MQIIRVAIAVHQLKWHRERRGAGSLYRSHFYETDLQMAVELSSHPGEQTCSNVTFDFFQTVLWFSMC